MLLLRSSDSLHSTCFKKIHYCLPFLSSGWPSWMKASLLQGAVYYRMPRIDTYSCQWWRTGQKSLHATQQTAAHFLSAVSQKPGAATELRQGGGVPDFEEWKFDKELEYNGVPAERWTYKVKVCIS